MTDNRRQLGLTSAVALVAASMVGAGVFTTSGYTLAALGTPDRVLLAWLVAGVVAVCGAICYGGLARYFHESGGEYLFLARSIHPAAGFVAGWVSLLAGFTGAIAFAATVLESYLVPDQESSSRLANLPAGTVASVVVLLMALPHLWRVRPGAGLQNLLVIVKFVMLIGFIGLALTMFPSDWAGLKFSNQAVSSPFSMVDFAMSLTWISLSYCGFNAAVYVSGEIHHPERTVPRALLLGTVIVMAFYLALNAVFVLAPDPVMITSQEDVAAIAAWSLGGERLEYLIRGVVVLSLVTSVSAMVMTGPRVYAQMAEDGLFPRSFGFAANAESETPRLAIVLQAILAVGVIAISDLGSLLSYLGFTLSVSAALTASSLVWLRYRHGYAAVPIPLYPLPPILFIGGTLLFAGLTAYRQPIQCLAGVVTILVGLVVYLVIRVMGPSQDGRARGELT